MEGLINALSCLGKGDSQIFYKLQWWSVCLWLVLGFFFLPTMVINQQGRIWQCGEGSRPVPGGLLV